MIWLFGGCAGVLLGFGLPIAAGLRLCLFCYNVSICLFCVIGWVMWLYLFVLLLCGLFAVCLGLLVGVVVL